MTITPKELEVDMKKQVYTVSTDRESLGGDIAESFDRQEAIRKAEEYLQEQMWADGEDGPGEMDAILVASDEDGDETEEEITLTWDGDDGYEEDVRTSYYIGIGKL